MAPKFFTQNGIMKGKTGWALLLGMLLSAGSLSAQNLTVKSGTVLTVQPGTTLYQGGDLVLDGETDASTLNNQGTLIIKGNLTNNNTTDNSLGNGTISFQGTTPQTISGPNIFGTLEINNGEGVSLTGSYDNKVATGLTLTNGRLTLGSNNLLILSGGVISGTPSNSAMVVATGTGELRKQFASTGSFTFPVGDVTNNAEYSPVTLTFNSGTFPADNYIGVTLKNEPYNTSLYTGSYLNRYWVINNYTTAPITGFSCDASFTYTTADITGTESELYCTKVAPDPVVTYDAANTSSNLLTAPGLSSFSTFTGTKGGLTATLYAWLEGPYNATNNNMNTALNSLLPLTQPYNVAPWNYAGTESVATMPADVVDWVLVSLRVATDAASATSSTQQSVVAALLKSDGSIVSTTGGNLVFYNVAVPAGSSLFPVIKHRNHLGIMANANAAKTNGIHTYDFRDAANKAYPGDGTGFKLMETGAYGLFSGDATGDGTIQTGDKGRWVSNFNQTGYLVGGADFNLDGDVQTGDKGKWVTNFNKDTTIPN